MNTKLLDFSNSITDHGDVIQILSVKNGIKSDVISKKTPIIRLTSGGSFFSYLKNLVDSLEPDELIVIACKKIVNQYSKTKEFLFVNEQNPAATLNGIPSSLDNSPMTQMYQFQITALNKEINQLNKDKDKLEVFKEKYYSTKREFDLQEDKHELNFEKERLKSENSLSSVLNGFKPEIQTALAGFAEKFGGGTSSEPEQQSLGNAGLDPASKLGVILATFNSLDDKLFQEFWELVIRFANIKEEERSEVLNSLRELTVEFNAEFEEYKNVKNK